MDPFVEVLEDAQHQITNLEEFLRKTTIVNENNRSDFNNNISELEETISDLKESVQSSKDDPEFFQISNTEINKREFIVKGLEESVQQLNLQWSSKSGNSNNPFVRYDETDDKGKTGEAEGVQDEDYNRFSQLQQEEMMREQDQQLDGVYTTMQNINLQARTMGDELEEQAYIIDEVDSELDRVGGKLSRGMRQVEHVIRKNQERAGDCCIGILIVALIVLLVLVIMV